MNSQDILSGKAGLAGIQWALSSRPSRRNLRQTMQAMLSQGCQIGPLHLTRAKYKPGKKLLAYYNIRIDPPGGQAARSTLLAVAWKPPESLLAAKDELAQTQRLEEEARESGLMSPFLRLQHDQSGQGMRIQVWPLDPDFPQLVRLGNPAHTSQLLDAADVEWPVGRARQARITPIRYRPGERHVLRYQLNLSEAAPKHQGLLYAKLYQEPEPAARAFRIANRLVDYLAANLHGFYGVRPVGMSSEDAVIFYPHAEGVPLSQQFGRSAAWLSRQLRQIGAALACLHQSDNTLIEDLKENSLTREVKVIARASEHVQTLLPPVADHILRNLERAQEMNEHIPQEPPTFTHSDFKADHLLISQSGIALIDFDTCALADPALDIGKFLADLEWWHVLTHTNGVEQAQQEFLNGYFEEMTHPNQDRLARARLYHALILMKITIRRTRLNWKDWEMKTAHLIQRAETILKS